VKAQLGLGHSYSRGQVQFDPNRQDKPIIQAIAVIDQLDKDINTFSMRIKEWFAWHFPELNQIVPDNTMFAHIVGLIEVLHPLHSIVKRKGKGRLEGAAD
jgi:nucleolar protein 56